MVLSQRSPHNLYRKKGSSTFSTHVYTVYALKHVVRPHLRAENTKAISVNYAEVMSVWQRDGVSERVGVRMSVCVRERQTHIEHVSSVVLRERGFQ